MSGAQGRLPSNRILVQRFAAHIAHLLNNSEVKPFALYRGLIQLLSSDGKGYRLGLVGYYLFDSQSTPEEAATAYFRRVLERPMWLARDGHTHKAHDLFIALCRRANAPGWSAAVLVRIRDTAACAVSAPPDGFSGVADRLRRLSLDVSATNPAKQTRVEAGPLYLKAGTLQEVPDELTTWAAICCAPSKLVPLQPGTEFDAFCSVVIQAVETANAHYGTLVSLGLSPLDWRELPINTAKKASAFLSEARGKTQGDHTLAVWREVWSKRQVPGFDTADELWSSDLGNALRFRARPLMVDDDVDLQTSADGMEAEVLDKASFEPMLALCRDAGVIAQTEVDFLMGLHAGSTIEDLANNRELRRLLGDKLSKKNREAYVLDLQERLRTFARGSMDK